MERNHGRKDAWPHLTEDMQMHCMEVAGLHARHSAGGPVLAISHVMAATTAGQLHAG